MGAKERAENFRYMTETVGWRELEEHIRGRISDHRNQLMTCATWDEVLEHRHKAEALESVFSHIQETIQKGAEDGAEV
ncbi:hypothetical protein J19TS2_30980 [Cohnella xylanilytica]|uniref:hypothetical protein n=1 Tax=Cohnella xylanilytica TaxID=557555 RepID=UPI001B01A701|nr:hypothetical protein [Cohnella xylanilytica]GIO13543.1 hypothetical protein J19TS2_30980 [Cohnella xylanilytica]